MHPKLAFLLLLILVITGCQRLDALEKAGEKVKKSACASVAMQSSTDEYTCPYSNESGEKKENPLTEITPRLINLFESKADLW